MSTSISGFGNPAIPANAHILELDARELQALARLPDDHAAWPTDAIMLSAAALAWLATTQERLAKGKLLVFGFWDHTVREMLTSLGTLGIDSAGAYRLRARA